MPGDPPDPMSFPLWPPSPVVTVACDCPRCRVWVPISLPELSTALAAAQAARNEEQRKTNARQRSEWRARANRIAKRRAKKKPAKR